jgi:hypothetical protein
MRPTNRVSWVVQILRYGDAESWMWTDGYWCSSEGLLIFSPSVYTVFDLLFQTYTTTFTLLCLVRPYPQFLNVDRVVERKTPGDL